MIQTQIDGDWIEGGGCEAGDMWTIWGKPGDPMQR